MWAWCGGVVGECKREGGRGAAGWVWWVVTSSKVTESRLVLPSIEKRFSLGIAIGRFLSFPTLYFLPWKSLALCERRVC